MSSITLTPTQHAILTHAVDHAEGQIEWFPPNVNGGARQKVLDGLAKRGLIGQVGKRWLIIAPGYDALDIPHLDDSKKRMAKFEAKLDQIIANAEGAPPRRATRNWRPPLPPPKRRGPSRARGRTASRQTSCGC